MFQQQQNKKKKKKKKKMSKTFIILAAVALVLSMVVRYQQQRLSGDVLMNVDEDYLSSSQNNNNNNNNNADLFGNSNGDDLPREERRVLKKSRDAVMFEIEQEREALRATKLNPALDEVARANSRVSQIRSSQGWFPSSSEKAALSAAEQAANEARMRLVAVQQREQALVAKLKPLYGLVSQEFFQEQRGAIRESLQQVSKIAYDNAWWSSIFNLGRAESITDVLLEFALQYAVVYALAYPFAFLYFVLWFAPTTIWAYTESVWDLPSALVMWVGWSLVMALPGIALYYGVKLLLRYLEAQQQQRGGRAYQQANRIFNGRQN